MEIAFGTSGYFSGRELREIDNTTLADVISRNTDMKNLPDNVFFVGGTDTPRGKW